MPIRRRGMLDRIALVCLLAVGAGGPWLRAAEVPPAVAAIRAEALRANQDPAGRPLPFAGHWNRGQLPDGYSPAWQVQMIRQGHHLLPWFAQPAREGELKAEYYEAPLKQCAAWGLPITLVGTQWEADLLRTPYKQLPPDENPAVTTPEGQRLPKLDPFGPVALWREVGRKWTDTPALRQLQEWCPEPPRVIFLSNNEAPDLRWHEAEKSQRYLKLHGPGRDDHHKRKVFGDAWIERYRALQQGMREGLVAEAWKRNARFVGYGAFGRSHFGRWPAWPQYALHRPGRIAWEPLGWDGGSPSYYQHHWSPITDHTVFSPQIESMNWLFMRREAEQLNPGFWFEISTWDGHEAKRANDKRKTYAARGQTVGPERYGGYVQFGLWLLRPRLVREFRGWTDTRTNSGAYFDPIVAAVDRVHRSPALQAFWRQGELVPSPRGTHPYRTGVPPEYAQAPRWFLLPTSATPEQLDDLDTRIEVFALAYELGKAPARRWLVYAHAPLGERKAVRVSLPGREITLDVAVGGSFAVAEEQGGPVLTNP